MCVLSKEAVEGDLATTGTNGGIQLEVGDPDITHAFVSCLELAIRRYFAAFKFNVQDGLLAGTSSAKKGFYPPRQGFYQDYTRECVENFSNSLLEESLLCAWDSQKNSGNNSQDSTDQSEESSVMTLGSGQTSHELTEASQDTSDISEVSNDVSQISAEGSQPSTPQSQTSSEAAQVTSNSSNLSSDISIDSTNTNTSQRTSNMSHSSSGETPTCDIVESLSTTSRESLEEVEDIQVPALQNQEVQNTSQVSEKSAVEGKLTQASNCSPVRLQLEKQNHVYRHSSRGGRARWNGTLVERRLPAVVVHSAWELAGLRSWLRSQLRLKVGLLPWYSHRI